MRRYANMDWVDRAPGRNGRPPTLSPADEFELYLYRKAGVAIKACASFFHVSVPTAKRIIAKFRSYDDRIEPTARPFREQANSLRAMLLAAIAEARDEVAHG